jgi:hypothetical protein
MMISRAFTIALTPEEVLDAQCGRRSEARNAALMQAAREAVALGQSLVEPAAVYDEFAVHQVVGEEVLLDGWGRLRVGPKADLLAPASRVMVAVYTIGPALERRVTELSKSGEGLLAYLLDSAGVMALGAVGESLRQQVEQRAAESGWGVSPALSPGSLVGWPVQGQRDVCALLPLEAIGVRLNAQYVLKPHKSVSMVVGLGAGYPSSHVGSVCQYCSLADRCWRRRKEAA